MFYDLPTDIQNIITKHLNQKDFITAKSIYDAYHEQLASEPNSHLQHNNCASS